MPRKSGRIAQDEVLAIVEQAVALERQRIESVTDAEIDSVGGAFDLGPIGGPTSDPSNPSDPKDPTGGTMGMYPAEPTILSSF